MFRRSTADQYVHFGGDIISNVESSHGIVLSGRSTGGVIEPFGDDTNIGLAVRAKNAAPFTLGNSSNATEIAGSSVGITSTHISLNSTRIALSSGSVLQVGSTAPFGGFIRFRSTAIDTPSLSTALAATGGSSVTIIGVNSSHYVMLGEHNLSTDLNIVSLWATSTNNEVNLRFQKTGSTVAVSASTATISFLVFRF